MTIRRPEFTKQDLLIAIDRAVSDERDRCACIAFHFAQQWDSPKGHESAACFAIADAIRKVEGGPTAAVKPAPIITINQPNEDKPASGEGE